MYLLDSNVWMSEFEVEEEMLEVFPLCIDEDVISITFV